MEIWSICCSADFFEVSTEGRVRSVQTGRILKPCNNGNGYLYVTKVFGKKKKHYYVHRLVAQTFLDNRNNLPEVNHKDGCKANNAVCNLEWCTKSQNRYHAYETGLKQPSEKQRIVARENAKKSLAAMQLGWKKWVSTEAGRKLCINNAIANLKAINAKSKPTS